MDLTLAQRFESASPDTLFTVEEVAALLRLPPHAVKLAAGRGDLRRVAITPRVFRYRKRDIKAYLRTLSPVG